MRSSLPSPRRGRPPKASQKQAQKEAVKRLKLANTDPAAFAALKASETSTPLMTRGEAEALLLDEGLQLMDASLGACSRSVCKAGTSAWHHATRGLERSRRLSGGGIVRGLNTAARISTGGARKRAE